MYENVYALILPTGINIVQIPHIDDPLDLGAKIGQSGLESVISAHEWLGDRFGDQNVFINMNLVSAWQRLYNFGSGGPSVGRNATPKTPASSSTG